jgi:phage terminase large subunit-like protein
MNVTELPLAKLERLERGLLVAVAGRSLELYAPYPKQREFHAAGKTHRERGLIAANQSGKSLSAGMETAMHVTGRYPSWWGGKEFKKPTIGWAAGVTSEVTRDSAQRILTGRINALGTGAIPRNAITGHSAKRGVADAIDTVVIRHGGGADVQAGESLLTFKSYDQGREKFQAETLDFVWCDEEPPLDIYTEVLTRTNISMGPIYCTFTPLLGMSDVVHRFLMQPSPDRCVVTMSLDDALHYTPEQRKAIIESYPWFERDARARGIPSMGSGRVYPLLDEAIKITPFALPKHWPRLAGMDFGWDHPSAVLWAAWDRDTDSLYFYDAHRASQTDVIQHAAAIKARGSWIPVAWPHDGNNDTAAGPNLAKQYRDQGVNMLPMHAQYEETPGRQEGDKPSSRISTEAAAQDALTRMQTGRLKVFSHLNDFFEEFNLYHRKDGKIVKERDDLMSAKHKVLMMLRYAKTEPNTASRGIVMSGWRG